MPRVVIDPAVPDRDLLDNEIARLRGLDVGELRARWHTVFRRAAPCLYRKSDSAVMVMKSTEDGRRYDAARMLDGAMDRSVLVERPMSPQLIIIGGILRQNPA